MQTLTDKEFKDKYGVIAASSFDQEKKKESLFSSLKSQIGDAFQGGVQQVAQGIGEGQTDTNPLQAFESGAKVGAGVVNTALSPLAPLGNVINKYVVQPASKALDKTGFFNDIANSPGGDEAAKAPSRILNDIGNVNTIAGGVMAAPRAGVSGGDTAASLPGKAGEVISNIPKPDLGAAGKYVQGAVRDITPTRQNWIDESIAKGLDLTAGDLKNIEQSTGNPVGHFMAENNLIGTNKATTEGLINNFFQTNYKAVRDEIGKVTRTYKSTDIPRYTDALKQLQRTVDGVPGMEKEAAQVDNMLNLGRPISLQDVQAVKELLDKHYNLYNNVGDVAQNITKQGLANVRGELKSFIENEVKKETGADIRTMNNNVMTSKGLVDAIQDRSTKGITKTHWNTRDTMMGLGLSYFGSPIVGLAYVALKKLWESPTIRLRFARELDKLSDKEKAKISQQLNNGEVPSQLQEIIGGQAKSSE